MRLVPRTPDALPEKDTGTWDCTLCPDIGDGGLNGWHRHYMRTHYSDRRPT